MYYYKYIHIIEIILPYILRKTYDVQMYNVYNLIINAEYQ